MHVLRTLSKTGQVESNSVAKVLAESGIVLDIHALRMALVRYYKQGLLKRERRGGVFFYSLSERGLNRLRWLESKSGMKTRL